MFLSFSTRSRSRDEISVPRERRTESRENGISVWRSVRFFSPRGKTTLRGRQKARDISGTPCTYPRRDGTRALGATGEINKRLGARQRRRSASLRDADACAATLRGRRAPRRKTGGAIFSRCERREALSTRVRLSSFLLDVVAREFPLKKRSILNLGKYFQRVREKPRQLR